MKKKRILAAVLSALMLSGAGGILSMAAPAEVAPVISIETDKGSYAAGDSITETVTIQNVTEAVMTDILIEGSIPEGYQTEGGLSEKWSSQIGAVGAGSENVTTVRLTADKQEDDGVQETEKPEDQTPGGNQLDDKGSDETQASEKEENEEAAQTGDTSDFLPWAAALGISGIVCAVIVRKRRCGKKILSLLLVVGLAGTCISAAGVQAKAAETENVSGAQIVTAEKSIMIDGKEIILTVTMTYQMEKEESDTALSYEGYELKWQDEFEGDSLNRDDWNVELHDPGWVNNELQAYVDSPENIYLQDGSLVIKPVEKKNGDGTVSYTSGRVNTQNKHDYKYGLIEARVKVPEGQGFLPAFWMMPTSENLYGQWPRCGEIDIMEVLGNDTDTSFGTIHYGNPHSESQGSYTLDEGTFSEEYHVFDVEWEPGSIKWYVDGKLIHEEDSWYSATEGQGEITYPAPFDQPFYIILNLAVGGNWPGNPDETTDIANAAMYIDYVRVYQKDSYDEDVTKPVEEVILRDPDENGNYIINGDFSVVEDLADDSDWIFLTALGGEGSASIEDNEMNITTVSEGTVDYSIQLVQPDLPMKKGGVYSLSFDAYADEARTMKVGVSAPDRSYRRYLEDTQVELTAEKKTYTLEFTMTDSDDANGRLEFNMGATGLNAGIHISNVSLKKTDEIAIEEGEKGILADGNYVYNGSFQEGEGRLGYWDVNAGTDSVVKVTNEDNIRRLMIEAGKSTSAESPVVVSQSDLALSAGNTYAMSFTAEGATGTSVVALAAGQRFTAEMTGQESEYEYKLPIESEPENTDLQFLIEKPGLYYIDNVRIEEDSLIKNGSFNAGFAGYEPYVDSSISSDVTYVVDSLNEDNAADFTINNTGDAAWKIQLKQNGIELENGQWYRLSLDAKASITRKLMFAIQRDGTNDDDWTPYSGEKIVDLGEAYNTFEIVFQMTKESDPDAVLSISMGAVGGIQITEQHRVCIDNIQLEKIDAPQTGEQPVNENLLNNSDFANGSESWENAVTAPGAAEVSFENGKAVYQITDTGSEDWNVQLKQSGIMLEQGSTYCVAFKAKSSEARTIKLAMLSQSYAWYGGEDIVLEKDVEKDIVAEFTMNEQTDTNTTLVISMGAIAGEQTPPSTIELSDISLIRVN